MPQPDKISEELQAALRDIVEQCEREDENLRRTLIRAWKKNEEFWHGFQYLFWSQRDDAWISAVDVNWRGALPEDDLDQLGSFNDFVIDIFKAHGESIIAALSAQLPSIRFLPDDADNVDDVLTAKTYNKIAELLQRHNNIKLIFIRALFYLYLNGLVASYRYVDTDKKYGTYTIPEFANIPQENVSLSCGECGAARDANSLQCQECGSSNPPVENVTQQQVPTKVGEKTLPKSRTKLEVFGPLSFKVPYAARNQEGCDYLLLFTDVSKDIAKEAYGEEFADAIDSEHMDSDDRFTRSAYQSEFDPISSNIVTIVQGWLRPAKFWSRPKEVRDQLLKKFPNGCHVTFVGNTKIFVEAVDENLDDRWAIGQAGLSEHIHSDPLCRSLVPIQEMRNQLVNLTMETIEHGIPSTFADSEVIDFDEYAKFEAVPGYIYKAKARGNQPLGNFFYQEPRSTLSKEVPMFQKSLDQDAQFSTGSFPSIYGGPSEGKSRTFSEYAASRQMALQRLSIPWQFTVDWFKRTMEGMVRLFVGTMQQDTNFVKRDGESYINVWIRRSELTGNVGGVESEASDTFPVSLVQKRDIIQRLMELNNDYVNMALYSPQNAKIITNILAFDEFKIPGEGQRVKQTLEIQQLIREEPIPDMMGSFTPSITIEPEVDDDAVHIEVLKDFLVDTVGLDLKRTNPAAYMNCKAHLKMHQMSLENRQMQQAMMQMTDKQEEPSNV